MRDALAALLDFLLPPLCALCRRELREADPVPALCESCHFALPWTPSECCALCQEAARVPGDRHCRSCGADSRVLETCTAALRFEGVAEDWLHALKYRAPGFRGIDPAPVALLEGVSQELAKRAELDASTWLVPVPLHTRRVRQRGFDAPLLVAHALARASGARVFAGLLERTRDTPSQTGLDRRQRRRNVADAFRVNAVAAYKVSLRRPIALVDDVTTTGATLEACARTLRSSGFRRIAAICLARTPQGPRS